MKKRTFQILDEMNQEDSKNGTQLAQVGIDLISADKVKGGCKISMGMPEPALYDIMNEKRIPILVLVDKAEYFKREKAEEKELVKTGIEIIAEERQRVIEVEGFDKDHDAKHNCGELTDAAVCYAMRGYWRRKPWLSLIWPFNPEWFKPTPENRIKELAKAGQFIAAEIDRLQAEEEK